VAVIGPARLKRLARQKLLDSSSTDISKQRCELPAGVDLSQFLPLANPSHRRLSGVNDGLRIGPPMIFSRELFR
jgi:hypothetical protein